MRTAVVTGSASGLGAAIAAKLEVDGCRVIGVDVRDATVIADLSSDEGRSTMVAGVEEALSGADGGLDVLVACAGVGPHLTDHGVIASVNFFGAVATLDGLYPYLQRGSAPTAVAITSNSLGFVPAFEPMHTACLDGDEPAARAAAGDTDGSTAYATAKHALAIAVRRRAADWGAAGIRLNGVSPGPVETPLLEATRHDPVFGPFVDTLPIPLGRSAQPAEIAGVVAFVLSPESAVMHGSIVVVDGGTDALMRPEDV
jgi:NAD(P)-dependent dehydrogenase (short-subunit alcohol dehydrogenase family)